MSMLLDFLVRNIIAHKYKFTQLIQTEHFKVHSPSSMAYILRQLDHALLT